MAKKAKGTWGLSGVAGRTAARGCGELSPISTDGHCNIRGEIEISFNWLAFVYF